MSGIINKSLKLTRQRLANWMGEIRLVPVLGNESADLDSILSSVGYSILRNQIDLDKPQITLPIINIEREDLKLRPEAEYVLEQCQVDLENLLFLDDPVVKKILEAQVDEVVLVDHNKIHDNFSKWSQKVKAIYDHHYDDQCHLDASIRNIETCGSATSLIVVWWQSVCKNDPSLQDWFKKQNDLCTLFLSPIIIDTVIMNPEFKRVTQTDIQAFEFLKSTFPSNTNLENPQKLYDNIQESKSKIGHLNNDQLFRKDYKSWDVNGVKVGIAAVTQWNIDEWIKRDTIEQISKDIDQYITKNQLNVFCILLTYGNKFKNTFERKYIYVSTDDKSKGILETLLVENPFKLVEFRTLNTQLGHKVTMFNQEETSWSRKLIFPAMKKVIDDYN